MYLYFIPFHGCIIVNYMVILLVFIHSSVDGRLGCFHFVPIMNNAAMNIFMYKFLGGHIYSFP